MQTVFRGNHLRRHQGLERDRECRLV
ncbi:hypothetical protein D030_4223A, partial [Vibrio parahaemolyticus AQ3810]